MSSQVTFVVKKIHTMLYIHCYAMYKYVQPDLFMSSDMGGFKNIGQ